MRFQYMNFLILSIRVHQYLFVSALNGTREYCERETSCENMEGFGERLPYCYCDKLCDAYRDCCTFYENRTITGVSGTTIYNEHLYQTSACITVDYDRAGFRAVNRCGGNGQLCSARADSSGFIMKPPVTDGNNVTYINADCAKCNNVTTYKTWGILITQSDDLFYFFRHNTSFNEIIFMIHQFRMSERGGPGINVIPPSDISPRVCYGKSDPSENCSRFQYPVYNEDGDLFKDPDCCKNAGSAKCPLVSFESTCITFSYGNIKKFDNTATGGISQSNRFRMAILLQFDENDGTDKAETQCNSNRESIIDRQCLPSIRIWKYDMEPRNLTLVTSERYDSEWVEIAIRALGSFLEKTKWKIGFRLISQRTIIDGSNCTDPPGQCTTLTVRIQPHAATEIMYHDIFHVESWFSNISFVIHVSRSSILVNGSMKPGSNYRCNCKNSREYQLKYASIFGILATESGINDQCSAYFLTVTGKKGAEKVHGTCRKDNKGEGTMSGVSRLNCDLVIFIFLLLSFLYSEISYNIFSVEPSKESDQTCNILRHFIL